MSKIILTYSKKPIFKLKNGKIYKNEVFMVLVYIGELNKTLREIKDIFIPSLFQKSFEKSSYVKIVLISKL